MFAETFVEAFIVESSDNSPHLPASSRQINPIEDINILPTVYEFLLKLKTSSSAESDISLFVDTKKCTTELVVNGIPQGSVLELMLFIVCLADITDEPNSL